MTPTIILEFIWGITSIKVNSNSLFKFVQRNSYLIQYFELQKHC